VSTKGIIIGPEYMDLMHNYLKNFSQTYPFQEEEEKIYLLRHIFITSKEYISQEKVKEEEEV
jgi:hypothetical protein